MGELFILHFGKGHFRRIQYFTLLGEFFAYDAGRVSPANGDVGIGGFNFIIDIFK